MSDTLTLSAETRDRVGKGASRALRREGRVPAVIYGNNQEPLSIHLEERALIKALNTGHFFNSVIMIEGAGGKPVRTLAKDAALDVVTDRPVHVDFLRISEHAKVHVNVPVVFTDEETSPGLKKGGVLNIVRHELELVCDAAEIPSEITISLDGLDVGASLHISAVTLPKGVESAIEDRDFTIATIVAPSALKSEEAEAAAEAEAEGEAEAPAEEAAAEGETEAKEGE
ncbi:50S ribosomal protein L25 [Sphingomonas koreensis]|jgi:large subunit ribosomal protein L25|uniref:Large ribosomal subunit protein bL25 n=1 Tax=Sphingomonas koreensis TaxID=93064 RepID=A0A1L6JEW0_9SPHN|nr:50S ribosomal protein L25/general stress protein Ctc [Sphingomonas koreensis]APR54453.1 50S ribosomal protein L25/general stress protein Ctc [Sphingomonas koreensis]MDC7809489.1 50S ribosomal protein L25/general stress protein Ctc [Sphingomonas koreensis]PJI89911.1 large subunit ribosomal protein L25 [Sphingomonas koreensis]RSU20578.1 50S ribosomal protein L25 [Sphingomonas koreensis]RSU28726.1 50S ribosomal protein L25 [Sphingomonas koreensis]